jgi:[acyl-carrier-protein] S-malonyltransferase
VRTKRLPVAGAFHSPLMEPAVEPFRAAVSETELRDPRVPVLSCVTAEPFDDVRERLVQAITHPVRWLDVMRALEGRGATSFVDTGPGRVLANLVRKSLEGVEADAPLAMEAANA